MPIFESTCVYEVFIAPISKAIQFLRLIIFILNESRWMNNLGNKIIDISNRRKMMDIQ